MKLDELQDDVEALLAESERVLGRRRTWSIPVSETNIALMHAFAGLRHTTELLRAMWSAFRAGSHEGTRVLARAHLEAAALTLYLSLGRWDALLALAGDDAVEMDKWVKYPPEGQGPALAKVRDDVLEALRESGGTPAALSTYTVMRRVQDLLGEENDFVDAFFKLAYKALSQTGAHANLRVLNSYLIERGGGAVSVIDKTSMGADHVMFVSLALHAFTVSRVETVHDTPVAHALVERLQALDADAADDD